MKKKILVVTGSRAEYGLFRSTMDAICAHGGLELKLLVTGMHTLKKYGDTKSEIRKDGYKIDRVVPIKAGGDMLQNLAQEIEGIRAYCLKYRPDCVLVLGDRDEPFAATIVAGHLNIPIAHIHGGDITGPGVDEVIRHAITKFAHIHFPGTHKSAERLRSMGEQPDRIFEVGTVGLDILKNRTFYDRTKIAGTLGIDARRPWLIVLQHPTVFDDEPLERQIQSTLEALKAFSSHEIVVIYPNTDEGSGMFVCEIKVLRARGYRVFKSLPRDLFMSAVKESDAIIGNSSAGIIETSYLGTPTVNIGNRQSGRERGPSVIDAPYDTKKIVAAIRRAITLKKKQAGKAFSSPYGKAGAGKKIADILVTQLTRRDLLQKKFTD